jgi:adenine-specific DNA-methyltransferase
MDAVDADAVNAVDALDSTAKLVGLALSLGAERVSGWSRGERALALDARKAPARDVRTARARILAGQDPLGDALSRLRSTEERRALGAVYTPRPLVESMTAWCVARRAERVVDAGAGSGRFLVALGRAWPDAELVAVETDPLATLLLRANVAVHGLARRTRVLAEDFRRVQLARVQGATLFVGNPPYVRHHGIAAPDKRWLVDSAKTLGLRASALSGLHAHFFLATAKHARAGDFGAFVTAAEWLDVNYGALVRSLFLEHLGGVALHVVEPSARPFADADTTAAIACFEVGARPKAIRYARAGSSEALGVLDGGRLVARERWEQSSRWSVLGRRAPSRPAGHVELGELCAVHRGQVTGDNALWIADARGSAPVPRLCFPSVTRARELFAAGVALIELASLRKILDLPFDLDELSRVERRRVEAFLDAARRRGADRGFIARHRKAWWSVGLRAPAPILATYMARRPPAFVRNPHGARHINIAHGLYPREPLEPRVLDALAEYLNRHASVQGGRTYAGGLTKFEPREMQRISVPGIELLRSMASSRGSRSASRVESD